MSRHGPDDRIKWSIDELKELYRLKKEGKSFREIADLIDGSEKRGFGAYSRKYKRMNWDAFSKDPQTFMVDTGVKRKWTDEEMIQLDAFLQTGSSYGFMAEKLNRSIEAVEHQAKSTDWKAWRELRKVNIVLNSEGDQVEDKKKELTDQLINHLLNICRFDFKRVDIITEKDFLTKINLEKGRLFISFPTLKLLARKKLVEMGFGNPEIMELKEGTYVIVGDSHGKYTKKDMFLLLKEIDKEIKPRKIIHIGHMLDDDNDISYDWGNFKNLIILARVEELKLIQEQRNKYNFSYDIVRESMLIGDLVIINQDIISDYVRTAISSLDTEIFSSKTIVNCHRLEFSTRCSNDGSSYFVSPGCLCENHVIRTIKQIDYQDGRIIKQAFHEGFIKYRRMGQLNKYWEQGMLVIQVDKKGSYTVAPCPIKKTSKGYTTSYFDKIISSKGIFMPDKKIFVNGDLHCDKHDINVLDIQEQICRDYKPDVHVNAGDTFNYSSLNHHVMDRGGVILDKKILDEAAQTHYILKRIRKWAKESYLICGNHERFAEDFVEKYPQFGKYLEFNFMCSIEDLGYKLIPLKSALKIGSATFIHGEMKMFGQSGSKLEKTSRVFSRDTFIGHIHRPEIRFGCYSIGLSGMLNQEYNECEASNWMHGFGLCNQFMGYSFLTTIAIDNNRCFIGNRIYRPVSIDSWKMNKYVAKLSYSFTKIED